jgi:branched-chain amino acid transport system permease protein
VDWLNAVVQGLLLGGQYALLACGLSLVFGVMRIVNLAHGALAVAAAYLVFALTVRLSLPLPVGFAVSVLSFACFGYLLQYGLFNRALGRGDLAPLLVAFGLSVVVVNLLQEVATADSRSISVGELGTASVRIAGGLSVGLFSLFTFAVAVAVIGGLQLFLARTAIGRAMRATSDDSEAARLMGIDDRWIYATATATAIGSVAVAGAFLGMSTQFTPTYGDLVLIFAFEAVIIGGLGSLWGTFAGGVVLGVAQTLGAQVQPAYGILVGHLVFLAVLAFRPTGLMPRTVTA